MARILAIKYRNIDDLMAAGEDELSAIPDLGKVIAESVVTYFADPKNQDLIERLKELGINMTMAADSKLDEEHPFYGKTLVFTGTMPTLERVAAQTMAQDVGAKVTNSVSKKTDYVVVGSEAGSKLAKAEQLGITVINQDEFLKLLKKE